MLQKLKAGINSIVCCRAHINLEALKSLFYVNFVLSMTFPPAAANVTSCLFLSPFEYNFINNVIIRNVHTHTHACFYCLLKTF